MDTTVTALALTDMEATMDTPMLAVATTTARDLLMPMLSPRSSATLVSLVESTVVSTVLPQLPPLLLLLLLLLPPMLLLLLLSLLLPQLLLTTPPPPLFTPLLLSSTLATRSTTRSSMFPRSPSRSTSPPTPPSTSSTTPPWSEPTLVSLSLVSQSWLLPLRRPSKNFIVENKI